MGSVRAGAIPGAGDDGNMIDANKFPSIGFGLSAGDQLMVNTSHTMTVQENVTITSVAAAADERQEPPMVAPSQNVVNLQARAAGVLPIRVDVPRAGVSHQFIKPLVVGSKRP